MQTFVPDSASFKASLEVLDWKRLGKQRVEALQIYHSISGQSSGWANHPAVKMWKGHEFALCAYGLQACNLWASKGYLDNLGIRFENRMRELCGGDFTIAIDKLMFPPWWGDDRIHASHRAALLTKDGKHYSQFGWSERPLLAYVWPSDLGY